MKIGIYSGGLHRWGADRYRMLRRAGFDCVDLSLMDTKAVPYSLTDRELEEYLRREKALADAAEIELFQMHGPWRYPPQDDMPERRTERLKNMTRSLRMASLLSCKNWVVHPLMPFGTHDMESGHDQETWEMNLAFMHELLQCAEAFDITICLENMPLHHFSISKPAEILRFVREMNDDHFKICLDTGHVAVFPDLTPGDVLRALGDEVRVLHVHDNNGKQDQHLTPYYGVIDWTDFGKALREVDFQGVFSFETAPPRSMPLPAAEAMYAAMAAIAREITKE